MNYIGIDIGSTASKVAVKGDHDLHFVLPTGWSSKETCQTIKDVIERFESCRNRIWPCCRRFC